MTTQPDQSPTDRLFAHKLMVMLELGEAMRDLSRDLAKGPTNNSAAAIGQIVTGLERTAERMRAALGGKIPAP